MADVVNVKQLLESGVHFGHPTRRWNPKMKPYIFTDRNGVYIIDLEKTVKFLSEACAFLKETASKGGTILFVGTKRQAQDAIKQAAGLTEMPYVTERWLGGMLTNFETVRKSVTRLDRLEKMEEDGTYQFLTKKEVGQIRKKRNKLEHVLTGVRKMKKLPKVLFVIDPSQEQIAVMEARKLDIPVVALIDTNCDPDLIDYLIPGNDDAIRSVRLICDVVAKAIKAGRDEFMAVHAPEADQEQDQEKQVVNVDSTETAKEIELDAVEEVPVPGIAALVEKTVVKEKVKKIKPAKAKEE